MALALGVSVGSATCAVTNGSPVICTNGGSSDTSSTFGIAWNSSNGSYSPQQTSGGAITQLFLSFNSTSSDAGEVSGSGYAIKASSASTSLTLVSNSTINMTESGSLEMRSGKFLSSANNKTITVDLSGVTSENYSLIGNLLAGGARGNTNTGTFGGLGINGSVTVDGDAGINLRFTQANGGITGNVTNTGSNATNIFTFQENGTSTIGGNVSLSGGNSNSTFTNINAITGSVTLSNGTNTFTFSGDNTRIGGNLTLSGGTNTFNNLSNLSQKIYFKGGNTTFTGASTTIGTIVGQRNVTSKDTSNQIVFDTTNSIVGNITQEGATQYNYLTNVIFNGETSEVRRVQGVDPVNANNVKTNTFITFNSSTSNKITGDITAQGGYSTTTNTITFTNQNAQNTILGNITVNKKATNTITSDYGLTIGDSNYTYNIKANTSNSGSEAGMNVISAQNLTMNINELFADNTSYATISGGSRRNIIGVYTPASGSTQESITAIQTGNIHIKKAYTNSTSLAKSGTAENIINLGTGTLQIDTLSASFGDNKITSGATTTLTTIEAGGLGNNTIVINNNGTLSTTSITATGGENNITTSGTGAITIGSISSNGDNYSRNASNTLSIGSSGTNQITGAITANSVALTGGTYSGTNTITFSNASATNTLSGNITASGGNNTISFAGTTNKITKSLSANSGINTITATNGAGSTIALTIGDDTYTKGSTTQTITATGGGTAKNIISADNLTLNIKTLSATTNGQPTTNNQNIIGNYTPANSSNGTLESITGLATGTIHIGTVSTESSNGASTGVAKNTIHLLSGNLTIDNLTASNGENTITSGANTTIGTISTNSSTNTITITGGTTNITDITSGGTNTGYSGINTISISSTNANNITGDITANATALGTGTNVFGTNTISFSGSGSTNTISASITANAHNNAIGKNNITFSAGTSSITGAINASGGTNTIAFNSGAGASSITGNISASGGNNTITFSSTTSNTLGNETSTITASGGNNNITFNGTGTNTFSGTSISIASGNGNNTFNIQENTKVTSGITATRTAGSGKNIFKISNTKSLTFADSSNTATTLTTNSGETNIIFIGSSSNGSGTFNGNLTTEIPAVSEEEARNTSLAKTTISFTDGSNKASSVTWSGDVVANNGGVNEFVISDDLTLNANTDGLILQGSGGNNQINFSTTGKTLVLKDSTASSLQNILTKGAKSSIGFANSIAQASVVAKSIATLAENAGTITEIDLNSGAEGITFSLYNDESSKDTSHLGTIFTIGKDSANRGQTYINFKDGTSTLQANIQTDSYGVTNLNFGSPSDIENVVATIDGVISNTDIQSNSTLGTTNFNINAKNVVLQYGDSGLAFSSGTNAINFENTSGATLSWKNSDGSAIQTITTTGGNTQINFNHSGTIAGDSTKASISTNGGTTTITLANLTSAENEESGSVRNANGVNALIQGAVSTTQGTTTIKFASGSGAKTLTLGSGGNTITNFAFDTEGNSTNNTIVLSQGTTTFGGNSLSVGETSGNTQALAFTLNDGVELAFTNGLTTDSTGTTTFNLGSSTSEASSTTATISGTLSNNGTNTFNLNAKNVVLQYGDSGLAFSSGTNEINFENTSTTGATLNWKNSSGKAQTISTTGGTTNINFNNSGSIAGGVSTTGTGTTTISISNGAYAVIQGVVTTGEVSSGGTPVVGGMIPRDVGSTPSTNVSFKGSGALVLKGENNNISNVTLGNGTHILSLTEGINNEGSAKRETRRNLVIDNITTGSGSLTLGTQANASQADTFIIKGGSGNKQGSYHFGIIVEEGVMLDEIGVGESGAVRLASVSNSSGISFESQSKIITGFTEAKATITTASTDENGSLGSGGYTSYYIGAISDIEVIAAEQEITATAFTLNYDLYMANLNSLNKRMGELRENNHSQ
ncbi:beta strand repeat-containing protein, partial [Helicobacter brantae]|uniref:beta strand repeat-containing protein n=1 Tax=Helicobacter brantae TaxID=375927 RepID=UPI0011C0800E